MFLRGICFAPDDEGGGGGNQGGDPPVMPEGFPEQFWDKQSGAPKLPEFVKSYNEAATFKTQHEQTLATLKARKPGDIKLEYKLPDTVKVPKGLELKIDEKDPRVDMVRQFAVKHALPQEVVSELIALDAQGQIAEFEAIEAEHQAEMAKLGQNGPDRVKAVETFLKATVEQGEYEALKGLLVNAAAFSAVEKLIAKATTQRIPPNDPPNPNPTPPPKPRLADRLYGQQKGQ